MPKRPPRHGKSGAGATPPRPLVLAFPQRPGDRTIGSAGAQDANGVEPNDESDESVELDGWISPDLEIDRATKNLARAYARRAEGTSLRDRAAAWRDVERALELDPNCAEAHYRSALMFDLEGSLEAAQAYGRALEFDPTNGHIYLCRASYHGDHGEFGRALADCNRAVQLMPREAMAYASRARIHAGAGNLRAARDDFTRALRCASGDGGLLQERMGVVRRMGDEEATRREIDRVLAIDPTHVGAWQERALHALRTGSLSGALAASDRVLALLGSADPPAHDEYDRYTRAVILLRAGNPAAALAELDVIASREPGNGYFRARRGQCRLALGDVDGALQEYDAAIRCDGNSVDFRIWRARILLRRGDATSLRRAKADVRYAIASEPRVASHRIEMARLHVCAGRRSSARRELDAARRLRYRPPPTRHSRHWLLGVLEQAGLDLGHAAPLTAGDALALRTAIAARPRRASRSTRATSQHAGCAVQPENSRSARDHPHVVRAE